MTWMKVDDGIRSHPKLIKAVKKAGGDAGWFWLCGLAYAREHSTDGFLDEAILDVVAPGLKGWRKAPDALVAVELWKRVDGGYQIRDYFDWNPSKAELAEDREAERRRKADERARKKAEAMSGDVSGRTPSGQQSPVHEVSAPHADAGAGAPLSSPSTLTDSRTGFSEGMQGEPALTPQSTPIRFVSPAQWARQHGQHVSGFCDWLCLPESVVDGFVRRLMGAGTDEGVARAQTLAWAKGVRQAWAGRVPGDDIFAFWRNEWAATHGSNKPASSTAAADPLAGVRGALNRG